MDESSQADLLKHLATLDAAASVVVVALNSELGRSVLVWSVALFFVSLIISVGCLAWKACLEPILGMEGYADLGLVPFTLIAYAAFLGGAATVAFSIVF